MCKVLLGIQCVYGVLDENITDGCAEWMGVKFQTPDRVLNLSRKGHLIVL